MKKANNILLKRSLKRCALFAAAAAVSISLSACGGKEPASSQEQIPEYVYVPEYLELNKDGNANLYDFQFQQDTMYYLSNTYDESAMTSKTAVMKFSPAQGGEPAAVAIEIPERTSVNSFAMDEEENIYFSLYDYSSEEMDENGYPISKTTLCKYDPQGSLIYEQEITEILNKDGENKYVNGMAVDGEGHVYLYGELVWLFDEEGNYHGEIKLNDNWINSIGRGKDGKIYVTYYDSASSNGGYVLSELDYNGKKAGQTYSGFLSGNGNSLESSQQNGFLVSDGTKLYEYDMTKQSNEPLLTWLDSDINGQFVNKIGAMSDGRILVVINDWNVGSTEIALLTKTKSSEIAQKEQITIGTLYSNQNLQGAAVAFNKSSSQYHVNIKTYIDTNNWTETSWQDGITALNNDITSGSNSPDILDLTQLNVQQLAGKGVFEDLTPYLENSKVLDKDDFMKNILDSFVYDGKLVSIPNSFSLSTVIGKTSDVGDKMGWTMEELMEFAKAHEGKQLFSNMSKTSIMYYCLTYNLDDYIDWNTGKCSFDSAEFKNLLEFVNTFPDEIDWESDTRSEPAKIQDGDVLLSMASIYDLNSVQQYEAMFNGPVTYIGYPSADGSGGCNLQVNEMFAVASKSDQKKGAWAFIENYLSRDIDNTYSWGFPTRQSKFDELVEQATKVAYATDENGEVLLDESGEAVVLSGMSSISYGDWEYTYHTPTEEEVATIKKLIEVAKPVSAGNDQINTIIQEESEAFFKGQKTVDDVANVIQNRAQIYVSENS